jgi:hypothetical protein
MKYIDSNSQIKFRIPNSLKQEVLITRKTGVYPTFPLNGKEFLLNYSKGRYFRISNYKI